MSDSSKTKKISKGTRKVTVKKKIKDDTRNDTRNEKYNKRLEKKFKGLEEKGFNESRVTEYDNYKEKLNRSRSFIMHLLFEVLEEVSKRLCHGLFGGHFSSTTQFAKQGGRRRKGA